MKSRPSSNHAFKEPSLLIIGCTTHAAPSDHHYTCVDINDHSEDCITLDDPDGKDTTCGLKHMEEERNNDSNPPT